MNTILKADVVVIGGGGAGLSAAVQAAESGAKKVVIVEQRQTTGGNAAFANGIFGAGTSVQRHNMIDADKDDIHKKVMSWNRYSSMVDPKILRTFINKTEDTVEWLVGKGIEFEMGVQMRLHYDQNPCWHVVKGKTPLGRFNPVLKMLVSECNRLGVDILYKSAPKKILKTDGAVTGLIITMEDADFQIETRSIIVATGGFIGDAERLKKYFPFYNEDTFGGIIVPYKGEGIDLIAEAGGALTDKCTLVREACQTYAKNKGITPAVRQPFAPWVNKDGQRFIDEGVAAHSQAATNVLLRQKDSVAFAIYDSRLVDEVVNKGYVLPHAPGCDIPSGFREEIETAACEGAGVYCGNTIAELADQIGCKPEMLQNTIEQYNESFANGYDWEFAKERRWLRKIDSAPYFAVKFGVLTVETIGPVIVNERMEVLDEAGSAIEGLYAAGVITAGWMAEDYCGDYLFGANLSYSMCSGRIAAENAAAYSVEA